MDSMLILLVIIGLLAGFMSGVVGIGGGIVMVPALVYWVGMSQHQAQGTSLFVLMAPVVAVAVFNYYKAGNVDVKSALVIMVTFVIGSFFGSKIAQQIPEKILKIVFGSLMIVVALKMIFGK